MPGRSVLEEVEDPLMARPRKYPPELLDRGARVVIESGRPIAHVARDLGVPSETLRKEVYELRRANEILKAASVFFATELDADRPK